jgi:Putative S-adenosyl-L-methionine-dependent methyltransferase
MPEFCNLPTADHYHAAIAARYAASDHGWLTPVECFSPYYSRAVARRVLEHYRSTLRATPARLLHVIEIGGGRGRLAHDVLRYFGEVDQSKVYDRMTYTIIEISPALAQLQEDLLRPWIGAGLCRVVCDDAVQWLTKLQHHNHEGTIMHILGFELLDNLAHDCVRKDPDGSMFQAYVSVEGDAASSSRSNELQWSEVVDPAVIDALHAFDVLPTREQSWLHAALSFLESTMTQGRQEFWVPTVCHNLLVAIAKNTGDYALTLADFSHFPGASSGTNGPVVQRVERGKCVVYPTVTDAPMGHCDIMFPTDFVALAGAFRKCNDQIAVGRKEPCTLECKVLSQKDFFQLFADDDDLHRSTCADGFNPVLAEFSNQSVLAIDVTCGRDDCYEGLVQDLVEPV